MPFFADDLAGIVGLADEFHDILVAFDWLMHRIAAELAEAPGELAKLLWIELLPPHGHHVIAVKHAFDVVEDLVASLRQVDARDIGAHGAGHQGNLEALEIRMATSSGLGLLIAVHHRIGWLRMRQARAAHRSGGSRSPRSSFQTAAHLLTYMSVNVRPRRLAVKAGCACRQ